MIKKGNNVSILRRIVKKIPQIRSVCEARDNYAAEYSIALEKIKLLETEKQKLLLDAYKRKARALDLGLQMLNLQKKLSRDKFSFFLDESEPGTVSKTKFGSGGQHSTSSINFFYNLELVVTTKCNLRCKGCSNLIPYYTEPKHISLEQLIRDFLLFKKRFSFVHTLHLIGGEALIYPYLGKLLTFLTENWKYFGNIRISTNGTILPNDELCKSIKDADAIVLVSDYGSLSTKKKELTDKLNFYGVQFCVIETPTWIMAQQYRYTPHDPKQVFSKCRASCHTLLNGRLYRCPFLAHAENINLIPECNSNSIDLIDDSVTAEGITTHIMEVIPSGCSFCSGHDPDNATPIPAAEQLH